MHSRQYYEPVEFYRQGNSGMRLPLAHNSALLEQYETSSQMSRRTTPSSESDRHGAAPRKRVPVACERCRKRKIKCSGDDGHGGCSNCRNAGLHGCQFLRVASVTMGPDSTLQMAQLRATQQHYRSHASHYQSYPYSHYSHSTASRYHPYSHHGSYRHHNHGHQQQYTPTQNSAAYASHPSTPCPPGLHADYSSYGERDSGVSWTRTNSYSGYAGYAQDEVSSTQYSSQQPANFLLPGADPMTSNGSSYGVSMYTGSRSNSQAHLWGDGMQTTAATGSSNYLNNVQDAAVYETNLTGTAPMSRQAMVPYQINTSTLGTSTNSDRVLPTPGSRHYSSGFSGSSTLDSLPLSAISHRSSIGWSSTDSASSASHNSSHTSATGSSICHEFSGDRSSIHRTSDSQDIPFNGLGFDYSPQQTNMSGTVLPTSNEAISTNSAYLLSKGMASQALDSVDIGSSSTQDLPSHHQRCRTVSQSSTPIVSQMPGSSATNSLPQVLRHHTATVTSRNHDTNLNEISEPTTHLDTSSAPSYSSISSSSSITTTYNPKASATGASTTNTSSNTNSHSQPFTNSPITATYPNTQSSLATTAFTGPQASAGNGGYTTPPITQPQQRGGVPAATPSSALNAGALPQSQTRGGLGGVAASGSADAVTGNTSVGAGAAGHGMAAGLSLLGYAGARRQGYVHVGASRGMSGGVGVGAGGGTRGLSVSVGAGSGGEEYGGQMAGDVGAVTAGGGGSGRSSVASMGYGLS